MTRIVNIKDIIEQLNSELYSTAFTVVIDDVEVLPSADFMRELQYSYYDMSFISHSNKSYDIATFIAQWQMYKARHIDEWSRILQDMTLTQAETFNPMLSYKETKVTEPDLTVESTTDYGKEVTSSHSTGDKLLHGKTTTEQTNTFDGELRNSAKSTDSGTDTRTINGSSSDTASGSDTNTTTTTGTNTETKEGYRDNPFINLQSDIDFAFKNNLHDMIITGFAREILFYDNGNYREGGRYEFYY